MGSHLEAPLQGERPRPSDKRFTEPEKRFADLQQARELLVEDLGAEFSTSMLDQANVEMAIVSGDPLTGKGLERFRFVPRADVFLRPFAPESAEALKPFFIAARMYTLPRGSTSTSARW